MTSSIIRKKLHQFIDTIEEKKAKAIYTLFEDEIEGSADCYTNEFKEELDSRYAYYKNGGKMITAEEADEAVEAVLKSVKGK